MSHREEPGIDSRDIRPGLDRRKFMRGIGAAAAMTCIATGADEARAAAIAPATGAIGLNGRSIRFADLSHRLTRAFNFSAPEPRIEMEPTTGSGSAVGMRVNRVLLNEHTGTHFDAPRHFSDAASSVGEIPLADLIVPLALIDVREKFAADANAELDLPDIERWERRHGRLPAGCCVAVWSGFDPLVAYGKDAPVAGKRRHPGFSPSIVERLTVQRHVKGVAIDSMSIDNGANTPAFPFHRDWLTSGRWAIEGLTNLAAVPSAGAVLLAAVAPIAEATGFPLRAIALF